MAHAIITDLVRIGTLADVGTTPRSSLQNFDARPRPQGQVTGPKGYQHARDFRTRRFLMQTARTLRHTPGSTMPLGWRLKNSLE
jgi:hypothetical protein